MRRQAPPAKAGGVAPEFPALLCHAYVTHAPLMLPQSMAKIKEACGANSGLNDAINSSAFGALWGLWFPTHGTCERFYSRCRDRNLLADYSRPLFLAAGLNPNTVGIALINNKSLNAFVANGQNIYFHTGLILESEDPNMVIGVIAHEIGHIIGGHLSRKASAINEAQRPALVATILGLGSLLAGAPDVGLALITGGSTLSNASFCLSTARRNRVPT